MEGNIVVDGVLASCYAVVDHGIVQMVMKPIQWYCDVVKLVFGDENGASAYISVVRTIGRWLLPPGTKIN